VHIFTVASTKADYFRIAEGINGVESLGCKMFFEVDFRLIPLALFKI
jgi:hypothetical protein